MNTRRDPRDNAAEPEAEAGKSVRSNDQPSPFELASLALQWAAVTGTLDNTGKVTEFRTRLKREQKRSAQSATWKANYKQCDELIFAMELWKAARAFLQGGDPEKPSPLPAEDLRTQDEVTLDQILQHVPRTKRKDKLNLLRLFIREKLVEDANRDYNSSSPLADDASEWVRPSQLFKQAIDEAKAGELDNGVEQYLSRLEEGIPGAIAFVFFMEFLNWLPNEDQQRRRRQTPQHPKTKRFIPKKNST
ncbi:MAG TPA: hypothetical protein VMN36_09340 [Verrucomicrobiales bacterium]|nr:hypothetical protein [Verrucomicrobiales bacterium]